VHVASRKGSVVVRRMVAVAGVSVLLGGLLAVPHAGASGGGACPPPLTNGSTTSIEIKNFCYGPTVAHVRPGDTITWVNRDSIEHTVTGANRAFGSYRVLALDQSRAWRFERPGVYPYYCVVHPGMVAAVVVGGDDALATAGDVRRGDVTRAPALEPSSAELLPVPEAPRATEPNVTVVLSIGAAIAAGVITSAIFRRRLAGRRTS
jgi:plastocyanin